MVKAIRMFTTEWCSDCWRAKRFLEQKQIGFEEIDIESDAKAAELVMSRNRGKRRVPTFEIDGEFHGNPRIDELARLLNVSLW